MALKLFEFQEQFMSGTFLLKLSQIEKTSARENVYSAEKPKN